MNPNEKIKEWQDKLVGKTYSESTEQSLGSDTVTKSDLPENHRVLPPDGVATMDFQEDRLNVHLDENNKVTKVNFG